ncbi:MurR/RpiR family transcriptional regulator [Pseudomonas typographi]|uniref:MurR/RpiR family transcriptional regulator n=1 Tax=Pseudomonas typographi TaxID=2715964 RepID=A0ABR7Z7B4_9PSED|nr:MurR/RpiR family transcriptional regulator [Pseudomonas typographi]MBD1553796.1 MurR/RpiR family transcriptional regulator [Pseudomonas typographi]MBD1588489.1 MurR/RpiR family transcriptional regulator [Pseudomonas typographi]MBD1601191.1 MurR/RpiR family transcriptional regulator [Pseudomonas typographi]
MNDLTGNPLFDTPVMRKLTQVLGSLKPAQRKVGEFILRNPLRAAMLSISEIGRESDTSPAAVNRLGNYLGMNGFTGLRMALVNHLLAVVSPHLLLNQQEQNPQFSLARHLRQMHAGSVHVSQHNAEHVFEAAVRALCDADRLFILGGSRCHPLAQIVEQQMIPYNPACLAISLDGGVELAARRVSLLHTGDTVVVMSLPPYNHYAITLAIVAREAGAAVVALTDSPASPLEGSHTLYAPDDLPASGQSLAPAFALVDALMAGVRARLEHEPASPFIAEHGQPLNREPYRTA